MLGAYLRAKFRTRLMASVPPAWKLLRLTPLTTMHVALQSPALEAILASGAVQWHLMELTDTRVMEMVE